jgi:hypothetical protein
MTPGERKLRARIAGLTRAATSDMRQVAAHARDAKWQRFLQQADPEGTLPEAERLRRAHDLQKLEMSRLSLAALEAKKRRRS